MKNVVIIATSLLFLSVKGFSSDQDNISKEKQNLSCRYNIYDPKSDEGEPYLYQVEANRSVEEKAGVRLYKGRFFFLGSRHDVPLNLLPRLTHSIIDASDVLVEEIGTRIFGSIGDVSLQELKSHELMLDSKDNWPQHLSTKAQDFFYKECSPLIEKAWNVNPSGIHPLVINETVSGWKTGSVYSKGMDNQIEDKFRQQGKPIFYLEDGKTRIDADNTLFDMHELSKKNSLVENVKLLDSTIVDYIGNYEEKSVTSSSEKKIDFSEYLSGSLYETDEDFSVQKRNIKWIPIIEKTIKDHHDKTVLFVFGRGHIYGNYGVISLLENIGYKITRISYENYPRPEMYSLCRYVINYTYHDLLSEILRSHLSKLGISSQEYYKQFLDQTMNYIDKFSDPESEKKARLSGDEYLEISDSLSRLRSYKKLPHHLVFQRDRKEKRDLDDLFSQDLNLAINIILSNAVKAKERNYGNIS